MNTDSLIEWLLSIVRKDCRDTLNGVYGKKCQQDAIDSYINDIDIDGYIEVNSIFTVSGNPETNWFPELRPN